MREFFYPSSVAVFGAGTHAGNLARNIVLNCQQMGFQGTIQPVGREPGSEYGRDIVTSPDALPDGIVLCFMLEPEMQRFFRDGVASPGQILAFVKGLCERMGKPIELSFFARRENIEEFKNLGIFPVFSDAMESVLALRVLLEAGKRDRRRETKIRPL